MKKILLSPISLFFCLITLVACSPKDNIKEYVDKATDDFISSKQDYSYSGARTTLFFINEEDPNFLSNDEVRKSAWGYASLMNQRKRLFQEANNYTSSTANEYRYNPNRYELAKVKREEAQSCENLLNKEKQMLQKLIASHPQCQNGGIWVLHEIEYKEYIYPKTFTGPYVKHYAYLFSDNGKEVVWKDEVWFSADEMRDLLATLGTKFQEDRIEH